MKFYHLHIHRAEGQIVPALVSDYPLGPFHKGDRINGSTFTDDASPSIYEIDSIIHAFDVADDQTTINAHIIKLYVRKVQ